MAAASISGRERLREHEPTDAQAGADRLRERRAVGDVAARELEERRERLALVAHEPVGIVLEHEQLVLLCELDDPPAALQAQRAAARVLEGRDEVEERGRRAAAKRLLERVGVEPLVVAGEQLDVRAELAEDLQRPVVGRELGEHALAGSEVLGEEHEPLQRAVGQEHTLRVDAVPVGDPLAQRRVARRRSVREDRPAVALDGDARAVRQLLDRQALGSRDTAREGDRRHHARLPSRHAVRTL